MEQELNTLGRVLGSPAHPFAAILGGAKISDKIGVIERLLQQVDVLLIGGGIANTVLKAKGLEVGKSLVDEESLDTAKRIVEKAGEKLILPVDVVAADRPAADADYRTIAVEEVSAESYIMDIGSQTIEHFKENLQSAKMVVWNGPLGAFEMAPFAQGSIRVAQCLAELDAVTVIGGGDSAASAELAGVTDRVTHVSTGGGAFLEFMEGRELPGVAALQNK
jgi:phosphoglycerate kinase